MDTTPRHGDLGRDPDAFEAFYRDHVQAVERFVARRVDDPQVAADLTADIFLAVIERSDTYRAERGSPTAWLFGVARNVVADSRRRRARELRAASRLSGRALLDDDAIARIESRIDAEREARRVLAALESLPGRDRALLELVVVDGLPLTDVAAQLGVEPGTARVRLHRARRRLADLARPDAPPVPATSEARS